MNNGLTDQERKRLHMLVKVSLTILAISLIADALTTTSFAMGTANLSSLYDVVATLHKFKMGVP